MTDSIEWAAGLFEGEGHIQHNVYGEGHPNARTGQRRRGLHVEMKDEDVVLRFAAVMGCGRISSRDRSHRINQENWSRTWTWSCTKWSEIEPALRRMLPYFGERRRAKAEALLADPAGPVGRPRKAASSAVQSAGTRVLTTQT